MGRTIDPTVLKGCRVLVVEDEPLESMDYCDRLIAAGAEIVGPYATVSQALASIEASQVDVALVDFALADQNSEPLQTALEQRGIPFVLLTGYPRVLVRRDDHQNVLSKPVSPDLLCEAIVTACR